MSTIGASQECDPVGFTESHPGESPGPRQTGSAKLKVEPTGLRTPPATPACAHNVGSASGPRAFGTRGGRITGILALSLPSRPKPIRPTTELKGGNTTESPKTSGSGVSGTENQRPGMGRRKSDAWECSERRPDSRLQRRKPFDQRLWTPGPPGAAAPLSSETRPLEIAYLVKPATE